MAADSTVRLRDLSALRQSRRLHFIRAALVGVCAACIAVLFELSIDAVAWIENYLVGLSGYAAIRGLITILFCVGAGFAASFITQRFAPEASGGGVPHIKAALLHLRELKFTRLLPIKFVGGALAVGSGFALGPEGPTVHLGAAVADALAKLLKVPFKSRSHLLACGAGAGLAAAFNAPLAGFLFVIEELRRELSPITYGAAFVAAVTADGVTRFVLGAKPSLTLPTYSAPPLAALPAILVIGLVVGSSGVLFSNTVLLGLKKIPAGFSLWKRGAFVGGLIGLTTIFAPLATSNLQGVIDHFLNLPFDNSLPFWIFGGYFLMRFVLTEISFFSGVPGGIFAPMLIQGALLGVCAGKLCDVLLPVAALPNGVYGIIGMAAFFAAAVRAPLTGVVLIAEMTGEFDLLFLLLVASLIAYLLAELLGGKPIYEALLEYDLRKAKPTELDEDDPVIFDIVVEPTSKMDGLAVRDLKLQRGCLIITVQQQGKELVPNGDTILAHGDVLSFLVDRKARNRFAEIRDAAISTGSA